MHKPRAVFIDIGRTTPWSWTIYYNKEQWWDPVSARHSNGTTLSFADGHSEYWQWKDPRTIKFAEEAEAIRPHGDSLQPTHPGNPDLHRLQTTVWRKLGHSALGKR